MHASNPNPQVTAAQRIAKKGDLAPLVRSIEGGAIELVSARRGRLCRYGVDEGGTTMLLESVDLVWWRRVGTIARLAGFALFLAPFYAPLIFGHPAGARWIIPAVLGMVVMWVGHGTELGAVRRQRHRYPAGDGWSQLILLGEPLDKPPLRSATMAQLRTVERLAAEGDRDAAVRETADEGLDVVTGDRRCLRRHFVDRGGAATLVDSCSRPRPAKFQRDVPARARRRYGGRRRDWKLVSLRPSD